MTALITRDDGTLVETGSLVYRLGDQVATADLVERNWVTFDVPVMDGRLP